MERRAHYSQAELAAFLVADHFSDLLADGAMPSIEQVQNARDLLGRLASDGERTRYQLERALSALGERNAKKRANTRAIIEMESRE